MNNVAIKKTSTTRTGISTSGLIAGGIAALGYTLASSFLRECSKSVDPAWVATIKAVCTTLIFVPILAWKRAQGREIWPSPNKLISLVAAGIFVQLVGNLAYQWALGQIGLALVVPLTMGTMVVGSAIGGRVLLEEKVSVVLAVALGILVISVCVLSLGGQKAGEQVGNLESSWLWMVAGLAACAAGFSYALLGITIRNSLNSTIPLATPMVVVGVCGVVCLGSVGFGRLGTAVISETSGREWAFMWAAALCNTFAFLALSYSLKRLPVIYVNAINVSQVAMAALVGIYIFAEPMSGWLTAGLALMLLGFAVMTRAKSDGGKN